jgi:hypothetical protein
MRKIMAHGKLHSRVPCLCVLGRFIEQRGGIVERWRKERIVWNVIQV